VLFLLAPVEREEKKERAAIGIAAPGSSTLFRRRRERREGTRLVFPRRKKGAVVYDIRKKGRKRVSLFDWREERIRNSVS